MTDYYVNQVTGLIPAAALSGSGAPVGASYVTLGTDATLTSERVLAAGTGFQLTDAGAGSTVTVGLASGYGLLSGLTSGRVPVASGASTLTDFAGFTYGSGILDVPTRIRVNNAGTTAPLMVGGQSTAGLANSTYHTPLLHLVGANATATGIVSDSYGISTNPSTNQAHHLTFRNAAGTLASPTSPGAGTVVGGVYGMKLTTGTTYGLIAGVSFQTVDASGTSQGGKVVITAYRPGGTQNVDPVSFTSYQVAMTPDHRGANSTTKSAPNILFTGSAQDNIAALTASTNVPDWRVDLNREKQHATGAGPARQSDFEILGATHSAVGASTYPKLTTLYVGPPVAGTNLTATTKYAAEFGGNILVDDTGGASAVAVGLGAVNNGLQSGGGGGGVNLVQGGLVLLSTAAKVNSWTQRTARTNTNPVWGFITTDETSSSLTASTNAPIVQFDFTSGTHNHATGAGPARHSDYEILGATHKATAASTYPKMSTLYVTKPSAGTNMTITAAYSIETPDNVLLGGNATIGGDLAHTGTKIGFFNTATQTQQSVASLTNNVTSGGTSNTIDDWTDLATYATDAAAIRNAVYQLSRTLKLCVDALRTYGAFA